MRRPILTSELTLYICTKAWCGCVSLIPLISTNLNLCSELSSWAWLRYLITSYTVAVLPVPGTPDMYKHLNNEETWKTENTGESLVNIHVKYCIQLMLLWDLLLSLKFWGSLSTYIALIQHYIVSSIHDWIRGDSSIAAKSRRIWWVKITHKHTLQFDYEVYSLHSSVY